MPNSPIPLKRTADWHLSEAVDWRPRAIFWRNLRKTPWHAWPRLAAIILLMGWLVIRNPVQILIIWGGLFAALNVLKRNRADQRLVMMSEIDSPVPQFPVDMVFYHGRTRYGEDSGLVTFCEGWLLFEGECATFSLAPGDTLVYGPVKGKGLGPDPRYPYWIDLVIHGKEIRLGVQPLCRVNTKGKAAAKQIASEYELAMSHWRATKSRPEGESVFPPIAPHPTGRYRIRCYGVISLLTIVVACVGLGLTLAKFGSPVAMYWLWTTLLAGTAFGYAMFSVIRMRRDLRELEVRELAALPEG